MAVALSHTASDALNDDLSSYTFSGLSLGAAASDRRIIVSAHSRESGAGVTSLTTAVTIGGVSAAKIVEQTILDSPGSNVSSGVALWWAAVPTGATGDVVVTYDGSQLRGAVSVYRLTGAEGTVADTATDSVDGGNSVSTTLLVPTTAVHAGVVSVAGAGGTAAWTGPTEDAEGLVDGTLYSTASGTSTTATMTPSTGVKDMAMVSASFSELLTSSSTTLRRNKYGVGLGLGLGL